MVTFLLVKRYGDRRNNMYVKATNRVGREKMAGSLSGKENAENNHRKLAGERS
jgi:hypothetical protein